MRAVYLIAVLFVILASYLYFLCYRTEEKNMLVVVTRAEVNPYSKSLNVVETELLDETRHRLILEKIDVIDSDDVWTSLKAGDNLVVTHQAKTFNIFGKVFILSHHDKLQVNTQKQ